MSGPYRTIVADPPWTFDGVEWASYTHNGTGPRKVKDMPYGVMDDDAIKALPVASLAEKDCRLFLWATNRHLALGFEVMRCWGFIYKQTLIWRKTGNPSPFSGSIAAQHHEYLMVGVKGSPPVIDKLKSSVIDAPAVIFGHSAKPDCFLDLIEQASPGPYVELFARRARFGWDYYGDESLGTAEFPGTAR